MATSAAIDDPILMLVCERFLAGDGATQIRDLVNEELGRQGKRISRERVYKLVSEARNRNYFYFSPPLDLALKQRICDRYRHSADGIRVVNTRKSLDLTAYAAADLIVTLIQKLGEKKETVHLGLGGGWTTMLVAHHLVPRLRAAEKLPQKLTLHAISSGFQVERPRTAPVAFFGFFDSVGIDIDYVGLFAPAVVESDAYERVKKLPGVKESFRLAPKIDLVITALGSASHSHGDFNEFMRLGSKKGHETLRRTGWVGDVQYRPYSTTGPITKDVEIRAVTLLELGDLVKLAKTPDKYVVLVAGPCPGCGKPRSDAVRPLLEAPSLKLWTHFVTDLDTARGVLQ